MLSINPADLALLDTQEWNARVLATAYGVPAVILNMALQGGGLTYQNPVALMQMWWLTELRTTSKRIMDAFTGAVVCRGASGCRRTRRTSRSKAAIEAEDDPQAAPNSAKGFADTAAERACAARWEEAIV